MYSLKNVPGLLEYIQGKKEILPLELNVHVNEYNGHTYKIFTYNKSHITDETLSTYGLCRSIIVNEENQIICFSPPKSQRSISVEDCIIQEFIDGTMINVFWNGIDSWEIATRSKVGGDFSFYEGAKTFREMFYEAINLIGLDINDLDKKYSYSFVLQHPDNRIVVPVKTPTIYLIYCYEIVTTDDYNVDIYYRNDIYIKTLSTQISTPKIFSMKECLEFSTADYTFMGFVFYNMQTGERKKFRNPMYEYVRFLRGNQCKLKYHYLYLKSMPGYVKEYLKYYPEHEEQFEHFRQEIFNFTHQLYMNYVFCYIHKQQPLIEFSEQYRTHMYHLHQYYIQCLRPNKLYVDKKVVIDYVNKMDISLLMHCLQLEQRVF